MDSLFTILFVIIAGIAAFFNQKAKAERERRQQQDSSPLNDTNKPGQAPPARPVQPATSWEAELRRLLEGEDSQPAPPPRPPPTMVVARQEPPPLVIRSSPPPPPPVRPAPPLPPAARPAPAPPFAPHLPHFQSVASQKARLLESQQAYARASQIDKTMSQHIDQVPGQRVEATSVTRHSVSPEITQVVSLFQNPHSARQAVLASIILGTPKALDESSSAAWSN